jgi:large subunit ribosomal protein L9
MKVILNSDVPKLGRAGELVEVKNGYGRNFLLPRKLALAATAANMRRLEHDKSVILAREAKAKAAATEAAKKVGGVRVTIARKAGEQEGKLFGSVTSRDVAEALAAQGVAVKHHQVELPEPIKALGDFDVLVKLHTDVTATVKVSVVAQQQ